MRAAPLAFLLDHTEESDRRTLRDLCRITHHHEEAYVGALAVTVAIRLVSTAGYSPASLLEDVAAVLPDSQVRDRLLRFAGFPDGVTPAEVADCWGSSGLVVDSVPLAIFAARAIGQYSFLEMIEQVIQAGGDTDTIGSIAGQIAGASIGLSALPRGALSQLRDGEAIARAAEAFGRLASAGPPARR